MALACRRQSHPRKHDLPAVDIELIETGPVDNSSAMSLARATLPLPAGSALKALNLAGRITARGSPRRLRGVLGVADEGGPEVAVDATLGQQFVVGADLGDPPVVHDDDAVRPGRRGEPVRDDDRGPPR